MPVTRTTTPTRNSQLVAMAYSTETWVGRCSSPTTIQFQIFCNVSKAAFSKRDFSRSGSLWEPLSRVSFGTGTGPSTIHFQIFCSVSNTAFPEPDFSPSGSLWDLFSTVAAGAGAGASPAAGNPSLATCAASSSAGVTRAAASASSPISESGACFAAGEVFASSSTLNRSVDNSWTIRRIFSPNVSTCLSKRRPKLPIFARITNGSTTMQRPIKSTIMMIGTRSTIGRSALPFCPIRLPVKCHAHPILERTTRIATWIEKADVSNSKRACKLPCNDESVWSPFCSPR